MLRRSINIQIRYNIWYSKNEAYRIPYNDELSLKGFAEEMILKQLAAGQTSGSLSFHYITPKMNAPEEYKLISDEQEMGVAEFIEEHKDVDKLIVQCDAGISRSAGMAAGILTFFTNGRNKILRDKRYIPNMFIITL